MHGARCPELPWFYLPLVASVWHPLARFFLLRHPSPSNSFLFPAWVMKFAVILLGSHKQVPTELSWFLLVHSVPSGTPSDLDPPFQVVLPSSDPSTFVVIFNDHLVELHWGFYGCLPVTPL